MFIGYQNGKITYYTEKIITTAEFDGGSMIYTEDEYVLSPDCTEYVLKSSDKYISYQKEQRKQEILKELDELDLKSIRAIRANDIVYIEKYEQEAQKLREELKSLQ